jgi:hypothetical protein
MLCACIYFSGKINEDFKRLRDIINILLFVKSKYDILNQGGDDEAYLNDLRDDNYIDDEMTLIKTSSNLTIENVRIGLFSIIY